jgi:hypothetical protein
MIRLILVLTITALLKAAMLATPPAFAQEASQQQHRVEGRTLGFELAVEGEPPSDATFFGETPLVGGSVQLIDPEGDGTYTGTTTVEVTVNPDGTTQLVPVAIWGGIGTAPSERYPEEPLPGYSTKVIKDFGPMVIEDGQMFSTSVSFVQTV